MPQFCSIFYAILQSWRPIFAGDPFVLATPILQSWRPFFIPGDPWPNSPPPNTPLATPTVTMVVTIGYRHI